MTYITDTYIGREPKRPSFIARVQAALADRKQRRVLSELTDEQLIDIGLTRRDVENECAKPFWG